MHWPYLLFVVMFGIAPLTRALLGNIPEEPGEWPEWVTTWLDRSHARVGCVCAGTWIGPGDGPPPSAVVTWRLGRPWTELVDLLVLRDPGRA